MIGRGSACAEKKHTDLTVEASPLRAQNAQLSQQVWWWRVWREHATVGCWLANPRVRSAPSCSSCTPTWSSHR